MEPVEQSTITAEQQACEEHFLTDTIQQPGERCVVKLPTKMEPNHNGTLLSSERRLHATERRLERDPEFKIQYHNLMRKYEELGHRDPVNSQERKEDMFLSTTSSF
jgi:hypothetical protein